MGGERVGSKRYEASYLYRSWKNNCCLLKILFCWIDKGIYGALFGTIEQEFGANTLSTTPLFRNRERRTVNIIVCDQRRIS